MNIVICHGAQKPENVDKIFDQVINTNKRFDFSALAQQFKNSKEFEPMNDWKTWFLNKVKNKYNIDIDVPMFPCANFFLMKYPEWEKTMPYQKINNETVLVGHSAGAGFVLKYMAKHQDINVRQIVLVAPWIDVEGFQPNKFYEDLNIGNNMVKRTKYGIDILISSDDSKFIQNSVNTIKESMSDVRIHEFIDRGHFTGPDLPEIMNIINFANVNSL